MKPPWKSFVGQMVTDSMEPHIMVGDDVTIEQCGFDDLKLYEIVVFQDQEKLISHVVWGVNEFAAANGERQLVTRGLQSRTFDFPVRESQIVGRVTSHPLGQWRTLWLRFKIALAEWV